MWRITGYSSVIPLPPSTSGPGGRCRRAARTLASLPKLTVRGVSCPASFSRPRCSASSAGLVDLDQHLGELALGQLEAGDGLAELHAVVGVVEGRLVAGPRRAHRAPQDAEAGLVEARQRALERRARRAARRRAGSRTSSRTSSEVTEARSDTCGGLVGGEARGVGGHHEAADAVLGLRPDHGDVGERAVGDPHLGAVEHPVAAVLRARVRIEPGRSPRRARSGRSSRWPRRRPCGGSHCCFCSSEP